MSMTREEAIVNLKKLIALFHTASEQSKMVDYSKIIETLEFAATALRTPTREQVEKVWRGEWKPTESPFSADGLISAIGKLHEYEANTRAPILSAEEMEILYGKENP